MLSKLEIVLVGSCRYNMCGYMAMLAYIMIMQKLQPLTMAIGLDIQDIIFSHKIWNPSENN